MFLLLASAGAFALVACGGGDDDNGSDSDSAQGAAAAQAEQAQASEDADNDDVGDDQGSINFLDEGCGFVLGAGIDFADVIQPGGEGSFQDVADAWQDITDRARREIESEMQVLADTFQRMAEILLEIDPKALQDEDNRETFAELNEVLDADAFSDASNAVEAWFEEECPG